MRSRGFHFQGPAHRKKVRCVVARTIAVSAIGRIRLPGNSLTSQSSTTVHEPYASGRGGEGFIDLSTAATRAGGPAPNWCAITSRRSTRRRRTGATARDCRASSSRPPSRVALRRASPKPWRRREFRDFLTCGCLAAGFARFRCSDCRLDRLVPFSCKGRGFCPSCGGRRMTDRAAHLVDHVFPAVPISQCRGGVGPDSAATPALPVCVGPLRDHQVLLSQTVGYPGSE